MAKYELTTAHFIEPEYYKSGTIIEYDGEPNEGMRPLDEAAEKKLAEYFTRKPKASINPVGQLPLVMVVPPEKEETGVRKVVAPKAGN